MKKYILIALVLLAVSPLYAQNETLRGVNNSLRTEELSSFRLPSQTSDMFFLDGKLHVLTGEMLFAVAVYDGRLGFPEIDTALTAVDKQLTYAVRHPSTGVLYYTKKDSKGNSGLYEYYEKKPGKYDSRRVKPYGFSFSIEHPVFSSDGRAMVFASDCPIGFGGYDLWYSEWHNGEWQYPQNLGHRINSEGDETMPTINGDFLVFVSDGRADGYGGKDLYSSRLVALEQTGDTVMMYPIGRSSVHSLEQPFCSQDDDICFAMSGSGEGLWLSRDMSGNERFRSFVGRMDCVKLTGTVSDVNGNVLSGALVNVSCDGKQVTTVECNGDGRYCLFLQPDKEYELAFSAQEHFVYKQKISLVRSKEDKLYADEKYNVTLLAFDIGKAYSYSDLFSSSVGNELSAAGRKRVDVISRFLIENPQLKLTIVSAYDQSDDKPFCTLLNNSRLRALTEYVVNKGVPMASINTSMVRPSGAEGQDVMDGSLLSAASVSSLTVYFIFSR